MSLKNDKIMNENQNLLEVPKNSSPENIEIKRAFPFITTFFIIIAIASAQLFAIFSVIALCTSEELISFGTDEYKGILGVFNESQFLYNMLFIGVFGGSCSLMAYGVVMKYLSAMILCVTVLCEPLLS